LIFAVLLATLLFANVGYASAATRYLNPEGSIQDAGDAVKLKDMFIAREKMLLFPNETPDFELLIPFDCYPWIKDDRDLNPPADEIIGEGVNKNLIHVTASNPPEEEWNKTFGGIGDDYANSVQQVSDGGYILAGWTDSYGAGEDDFWLVRTDSNGNELWNRTFGGTWYDEAFSVQTLDDGYIMAGIT